MSPRRNWGFPNPSPASECALPPYPPDKRVGWHTRLQLRGWGSSNSDDWRKSIALCLLCACYLLFTSVKFRLHRMCFNRVHSVVNRLGGRDHFCLG